MMNAMRRLVRDFVNQEKLWISVVFIRDTLAHPLARYTEQLREKPVPHIAIIVTKVIF